MSKTNKKNYFAPSTLGLGAMRRASMMLLVMMLSVLTTWADDYPAYITDIILVGGTESEMNTAKNAHSDYTFISQDLNQGAGGDYINLGYKTSNRASTNGGYITDIIVIDAEGTNPPSTVTYQGRTYYLCDYDGGSWFESAKGNLNSHCGDGWNLYLYYTKQEYSSTMRAVDGITVNSTKSGSINCYYTNGNLHEDQIDLNRGISGSGDVYMHLSTTTKKNRPASDPTMKTALVYNGEPLQLVNYNPTSQCTMYYCVGTSGSYTSTVANITATNAGTYTVYYYAGSNSYGNSGPTFSKSVTIAKAANSGVTVSCADLLEGNAPQPALGGTNLSTGAVTYKYSTSQNGTYSTTVPTAAGTYWVKATIASDGNCNEYTTAAASFKMTPDWALHNSGDSEADAYVINTTGDLDLLAQRVNSGNDYQDKYFELGANIMYDKGVTNNFTPIGNESYIFKGKFDGKGFTISGLNINLTGKKVALFGATGPSAEIKNLTIANSTITADSNVGAIIGFVDNATIKNCVVANNVSVSGAYFVGGVGGLYGKISGCVSAASVSGTQFVGGVIGAIGNGSAIQDNLYIGSSVTGGDFIGAIVGRWDNGTLTNNYHIVNGLGAVRNADTNGARKAVEIKAATGVTLVPTGTATTYSLSGITIYEGNKGIGYDGKLYAGATEQVMLSLSYSSLPEGFEFSGYTDGLGNDLIDNDNDVYTLTMTSTAPTVSPSGTDHWLALTEGRNGSSAEKAYKITTTAGLNLLAQRVNNGTNYSGKYFELGADITYDGTENNFTPIGTNYDYRFRGIFDGKGHVINGININLPNNDHVGLFGNLRSATVKNVTLTNSNITGRYRIGGIVGNCESAVIENCHTTNTVTINANDEGGGIAGFVDNTGLYSQIKGCTSAAAVNGIDSDYSRVGGLVGVIRESNTVQDCLYLGNTVNGYRFGAIAGSNIGTFTNTYHTVYGMGALYGRDRKEDDFFATYAITSDTKPDGFGDATVTYGTGSYAGITAYGTNGLEYMGVYYRYGENIVALEDNKNNECVIIAHFSSTCTVTLKDRTLLKNGDWNTLCLPFGLSAEQIAASPLAGATIKKLDGTTSNLDNNGKLTLNFSPVTEIEAGKPYIVKWTTTGENISNPVFSDVKIDSRTPTEVNFSGGKFVGNYAPFTIDDGNKDYVLFFSTGNKIGYSKTTPRTLKCMRAHLEMTNPNAARSIELDFGEGETTGIDGLNGELKNGKIEELKFYDLNGRRVENPTKGIYIVNGKKVVIK